MLAYQIYKLDAKGQITGPALVLFCEQDEDVIRKVGSLVDGYDVEVRRSYRNSAAIQRRLSRPIGLQGGAYSTAAE